MDLNALALFAEVARYCSFSGAARANNIPTTTVSRKIQQLESDLEVVLLHRTTRRVTVTEAGEAILQLSQGLLDSNTQIEQWCSDQSESPSGTIRITAPASFARGLLSEWVLEFQKRHHQIRVELITGNRYLDLIENNIDFAFRQGPLPDSTLIAKRLLAVPYGIVASPLLENLMPQAKHPDDLQTWPAIAVSVDGWRIPWRFTKGEENYQWQPTGRLVVEDLDTVRDAVLEGLGISQLPLIMVEQDLKDGCLVPLLADWWPAASSLYMVYPERQNMPAKNGAFLNFVEDELVQRAKRRSGHGPDDME